MTFWTCTYHARSSEPVRRRCPVRCVLAADAPPAGLLRGHARRPVMQAMWLRRVPTRADVGERESGGVGRGSGVCCTSRAEGEQRTEGAQRRIEGC